MPIELTVKKIGDTLIPVTTADIEAISGVRQGQGFRVELIRVSDRSIQHHRLYFGGLIRLVADYWEPDSGLVSRYDKRLMNELVTWVAEYENLSEALSTVTELFLEDRANRVRAYLPDYEKAAVKLNSIHEWLKEEAGFYDAILTPTGVKKHTKSINFNAMPSQAEFDDFYQKVFSVAWRYVLSRNHFSSQKEAENVALQMASMG